VTMADLIFVVLIAAAFGALVWFARGVDHL
jgi:hypothetical protein